MNIFLLILSGFVGGITASMGMGGGTFLLPILTIFFGIDQHIAQSTNLIVFLPIAIVSTIIYLKKKMIDKHLWWQISLPASLIVLLATILSFNLSSKILKILFGVFLIIVGLLQFIFCFVRLKKKKKSEK